MKFTSIIWAVPVLVFLQDITWYPMHEARRQAADQDKIIVVYFHTEWCTYCRRMEKEVFTDDGVTETLSKLYYPVKVDAESSQKMQFGEQEYTGEEFALVMGVRAFPTFLFMNASGEIIRQQEGYMDKDLFLKLIHYVGTDAWREIGFERYSIE